MAMGFLVCVLALLVTAGVAEPNHYYGYARRARKGTQDFLDSWNAACHGPASTVVIPKGHTFVIGPAQFTGPCNKPLTIQVDGTIRARGWQGGQIASWLAFVNVVNLSIIGSGTVDGSGALWWQRSCKQNMQPGCQMESAPTALSFYGSSGIRVDGITVQNAPQMNMAFVSCDNVHVNNVRIQCPPNSPNTDAVHLKNSHGILIEQSSFGTGDDCVSIGSGSSNVVIRDCVCGPGHGISIGSLGRDGSESIVHDVLVQRVQIKGTLNGARIKTWQGGSGRASNVRFEDITMDGVVNPIIIDQHYCDHGYGYSCTHEDNSAVQVSNIQYVGVRGTSATREAIKFACSKSFPCDGISLANINLVSASGNPTVANCTNAFGRASSNVVPRGCFS